MTKTIYRKTISTLLAAVDDYKAQKISLESYQSEIFKAEREIASIEEKELRSLLENHENQLELIKFTTGDEDSVRTEVNQFKEELKLWL